MKYNYSYYKENGLCPQCGKPAENGKVHCAVCTDKRKQYMRDTRKFCKENKICPICQKRGLCGDEKTCLECKAKRIYKPSIKSRKEYFDKRKADGFCISCSRKAKEGHTYCEYCLIKKRDKAREKNGFTRIERAGNNKCYICGDDAMKYQKVCEKHYNILVENIRRSNGNICYK